MIKIQGVRKVYAPGTSKEVTALKDISLTINKGEIFGVIGLSGAGKSTLIRMINFLEVPTAGTVEVDGIVLNSLSQKELRAARRHIGMIFQSFNLLSHLTVKDNVAFPLRLDNALSKDEINARTAELLSMVGLSEKANVYPSELSGGQKQRVGIARALAGNPKVLLCDEATSALDPKTTSSILELLMELRQKLNLTIVIITHQMEVIKQCCDRVAVIDGGVITEMGSALEVFTDPKQDLTKRLVSAVVRRGLPDLIAYAKVVPEYHPGAKAVVELLFLGPKADAPVIVDVAKECQVSISLLAGDIDRIQEQPFGVMVVEIAGTQAEIEGAIAEFERRVHRVEVLGYDERKQLSEF